MMLRLWTSLAVLALAGAGSPERQPIVGILSSPLKLPGAKSFGKISWIWATYVRTLHDVGAQVVPLLPDAGLDTLRKKLSEVDAVLLPGGEDDAGVHGMNYPDLMMQAIQVIYDEASKSKNLPVWGTCMGFQALCVAASGDPSVVVPTIGTVGKAIPLHFTEAAGTSRILRDAPEPVWEELRRHNSTLNYHSFGVMEESFLAHRVTGFKLLAVDHDAQGKEFGALMEHADLPIFGSQFHPELYHAFASEKVLSVQEPLRKENSANMYLMKMFVEQARHFSRASSSQSPMFITSYPQSVPPMSIFGDSFSKILSPTTDLRGYVFNATLPITPVELELAITLAAAGPAAQPGQGSLPLVALSLPAIAALLVLAGIAHRRTTAGPETSRTPLLHDDAC